MENKLNSSVKNFLSFGKKTPRDLLIFDAINERYREVLNSSKIENKPNSPAQNYVLVKNFLPFSIKTLRDLLKFGAINERYREVLNSHKITHEFLRLLFPRKEEYEPGTYFEFLREYLDDFMKIKKAVGRGCHPSWDIFDIELDENTEIIKPLSTVAYLVFDRNYRIAEIRDDFYVSNYQGPFVFPKLDNLEIIGKNFLARSHVTSVKIEELESLEIIRDGFLKDCKEIKILEISKLDNLVIIGVDFCYDCSDLKKFSMESSKKLELIGYNFLCRCPSLEIFDIPELTKISEIRGSFLRGCKSLDYFDMRKLRNIRIIGPGFLSESKLIKIFDMSEMSNLEEISYNFMDCSGVELFSMNEMPKLREIDRFFLCGSSVKIFTISKLPKLKTILGDFLCETMITSLILEDLPELNWIGSNFLTGNISLKSFHISGTENLKTIDEGFLRNCPNLDPESIAMKKKLLEAISEKNKK